VPRNGNSRGQSLTGTSARDVDLSFRFRADKAPAGGNQFVYAVVRRAGNDEYRAKVRFAANGSAWIRASRVVNGAEADLGSEVAVQLSATWTRVRVQVMGADPTAIRIKAWDNDQTEPLAWQWLTTDSTASLQNAGTIGVRTYLASATTNWPVTFTIDDLVLTDPRSSGSSAPPAAPPTEIALDTFTRTITDTWGRANVGGVWSVATHQSEYDVNGSRGLIVVPAPGQTRTAVLPSIEAGDVDLSFRIRSDSSIVGNGAFVYGLARRTGARNEYRIKVRIAGNGRVYVQPTRLVKNVETNLGPEVRVPNVDWVPGTELVVRGQLVGSSPTSIRIRAWPATAAEPATWLSEVTDGSPVLQNLGAVGLKGYLSSSAAGPVTLSFDDFRVVAP
jgi:hypothetical protein